MFRYAMQWLVIIQKAAQRAHDVESTSIPRGYYVDMSKTKLWRIPRHLHVLFRCNFADRKIHVASMFFFFDVILMVQKPTSFQRTSFSVISMVKKYMLFPRTFFDAIVLVEISMLFPRTFFDVISMIQKSTLLRRTFFDVISLVKNSESWPKH